MRVRGVRTNRGGEQLALQTRAERRVGSEGVVEGPGEPSAAPSPAVA